ncbi:MAG: hypothetical protein HZB25_04070 [Candidatus Eisenbacteria bacterium]|nr:hypothetical protein [Candidatus Eisenbacteria bacterium]
MNPILRSSLFWAPRGLCIALAMFLGLFGIDVFQGSAPLATKLLGFVIHLLPTWIILAMLAVAWRWEWVGGAILLALSAAYAVWAHDHPNWILLIAGPAVLVGVLFLVGWFLREEIRGHSRRKAVPGQ